MKNHDNDPKKRLLWIVDYDLTDAPCRRQFYRKMKKILGKTELASISSSMSVLATGDEQTARTIHGLASKCGVSHLYETVQGDVPPKSNNKPIQRGDSK